VYFFLLNFAGILMRNRFIFVRHFVTKFKILQRRQVSCRPLALPVRRAEMARFDEEKKTLTTSEAKADKSKQTASLNSIAFISWLSLHRWHIQLIFCDILWYFVSLPYNNRGLPDYWHRLTRDWHRSKYIYSNICLVSPYNYTFFLYKQLYFPLQGLVAKHF